jgi:hypothetical protein
VCSACVRGPKFPNVSNDGSTSNYPLLIRPPTSHSDPAFELCWILSQSQSLKVSPSRQMPPLRYLGDLLFSCFPFYLLMLMLLFLLPVRAEPLPACSQPISRFKKLPFPSQTPLSLRPPVQPDWNKTERFRYKMERRSFCKNFVGNFVSTSKSPSLPVSKSPPPPIRQT